MAERNSKTVYVALASNAAIMVAKFVAGAVSGSASLIAEGLHSVADTGDAVMVLIGQRRSRKPPDDLHPFGHGKELYFWTMVVAISIFGIGGAASVFEGIRQVAHPSPLRSPVASYVALGVALLAEGTSMIYAWRQFFREKGKGRTVAEGVKHAKDPTIFLIVFEDTAAVAGVIIAAAAVFLSHRLEMPRMDGVGAIVIGLLMASVGAFLIYEISKLLVGERAVREDVACVRELLERDPAVRRADPPRTAHFGPNTLLVAVRAEFDPSLCAEEITAAIERLHETIRREVPEAKYVFIEPGRSKARCPQHAVA